MRNITLQVGKFTVSIGQGRGYYASPGTVEVAIKDKKGGFVTREYRDSMDDVLGYQTAQDLAYILEWCLKMSDTSAPKSAEQSAPKSAEQSAGPRPIRVIRR